jgi:uncharacterized protein YndB with AHSA1/START domain
MTDRTATAKVFQIYIKTTPQAIWDAITRPEWSERYGYGGRVSYDLKAGGAYVHHATAEMKSLGMPDEMIVGKVIESDPPRRLVQTWRPNFSPETAAEPATRLTYEIAEYGGGLCTLTIIHDAPGAPLVAGMVSGGGDPMKGGGGWPWVLSDLKSLLETGKRMAA